MKKFFENLFILPCKFPNWLSRDKTSSTLTTEYAAAKARGSAGYVEGTQLDKISNMTPSAANTSGVRGVYYESKFDRWRAQIIFQRKRYYLGTYKNKEDAIKARLAAEADLYEPFLERLKEEATV